MKLFHHKDNPLLISLARQIIFRSQSNTCSKLKQKLTFVTKHLTPMNIFHGDAKQLEHFITNKCHRLLRVCLRISMMIGNMQVGRFFILKCRRCGVFDFKTVCGYEMFPRPNSSSFFREIRWKAKRTKIWVDRCLPKVFSYIGFPSAWSSFVLAMY